VLAAFGQGMRSRGLWSLSLEGNRGGESAKGKQRCWVWGCFRNIAGEEGPPGEAADCLLGEKGSGKTQGNSGVAGLQRGRVQQPSCLRPMGKVPKRGGSQETPFRYSISKSPLVRKQKKSNLTKIRFTGKLKGDQETTNRHQDNRDGLGTMTNFVKKGNLERDKNPSVNLSPRPCGAKACFWGSLLSKQTREKAEGGQMKKGSGGVTNWGRGCVIRIGMTKKD